MPDLQGFDHFTVVCRDLNESLRFYTEVLGATVVRAARPSAAPGSPAGLAPVGIRLGTIGMDLFQADGDWQPYPGTYAQHFAFNISWEDVDSWFAHMQDHGIQLQVHPAGNEVISLYFTDPTGYHMELNLRSRDPDLVERERERLLKTYGNLYRWDDGFGVPDGQPQAHWATRSPVA
jgi:glyoxylase I family protein